MPELGPIAVETSPSNDLRSYHVSSEKIKRELGWTPAADHRGRRARPLRGVPGREGRRTRWTTSAYYNVKTIQASGLA